LKITCVGAGNVAWQLTHAMDRAGHTIEQIISRTEKSAKALAVKFGAHFSTDVKSIYDLSDIILIAVPDDKIEEVVRSLPPINGILAHTCGSRDLEILSAKAFRYGVFYPLQTLNKNLEIDISKVPILIESSDTVAKHSLDDLARSISDNVQSVTSEERAKYQLAAVIANNFSNHLFSLSENYLKESGLDFKMLVPLIEETARKLKNLTPFEAQTGPARRGDTNTHAKHMAMLQEHPDLAELYKDFSEKILNIYSKSTDDD